MLTKFNEIYYDWNIDSLSTDWLGWEREKNDIYPQITARKIANKLSTFYVANQPVISVLEIEHYAGHFLNYDWSGGSTSHSWNTLSRSWDLRTDVPPSNYGILYKDKETNPW